MQSYKIYFIRHGAVEDTLKGKYIGRTDVHLSEKGKNSLKDIDERFGYPYAEKIYSSPLSRCTETCSVIYPEREIKTIGALSECDFGDWEGKTASELAGDAKFALWLQNSDKTPPPNGESGKEFASRVCRGFATAKSKKFDKSFIINQSCTVKAKAFKKGMVSSFATLRQFDRLNIKNTTFVNPPVERYGKDADIALMDGKKGVPGDYYNDWLGFEGVDMEATIELAVPTTINIVKVGLCHEPQSWVMWPKGVWVSFSKDGKQFTDWQMAELPVFDRPDKMQGFGRIEARLRTDGKEWKYVRVKVENQGVLPDWHPYKGQKAWIMVDEVVVE